MHAPSIPSAHGFNLFSSLLSHIGDMHQSIVQSDQTNVSVNIPSVCYLTHTNQNKELTVRPVLKGVLALEELASGVVSFTDSAGVQRGLGTQDLVTAHCLHTHKQTHTISAHRWQTGRYACLQYK